MPRAVAVGLALLALLAGLSPPGTARAHEVRPGYLELRQLQGERWEVLFKVPAKGDLRLGLYARLPERCDGTEPRRERRGGAWIERWRTTCAGGLQGAPVTIEGLAGTRTDVLARVETRDGASRTVRLTPASPSFRVSGTASWTELAGSYGVLGVEHILQGVDHLLFVFALLLLVEGTRRLVETLTAFTVAHSLTLAAATFGWVHVPPPPVEAVIALSIVFLAAEIVHATRGRPGLTQQRPWLVAFAFGLLHGLGFAGALTGLGLPEASIPWALLFFNLGVEVGQLLFVAVALTTLAALARLVPWRGPGAARATAYAIGLLAAWWTLDRVTGFMA